MKKLIFALLAVVAMVACEKEGGSQKSIELTGGTSTNQTIYADETSKAEGIKFKATEAWTANVTAVIGKAGGSEVDWLKLNMYEGGAGDYNLIMSVLVNSSGSDRKAQIKIVSGQTSITIIVEQKAVLASGELIDNNIKISSNIFSTSDSRIVFNSNINVVSGSNSEVVEAGICWGASKNPTISNNTLQTYVVDNMFISEIENLDLTKQLYFRTYVKSAKWIAYSNEMYVKREGLPFGDGDGSENNPYLIKIKEHLVEMSKFNNGYFKIACDIDLSCTPSKQWEAIQVGERVVIDGNDKIISGLYIDHIGGTNIGFIGINKGTVTNLSLIGTVSGKEQVGGIVACNRGVVKNCNFSGYVKGVVFVGGIAGYNNDAVIEECFNTGEVEGEHKVGGIVGSSGLNDGELGNKVIKCNNSGGVTGGTSIGGIAGVNYGVIEQSGNTCQINGFYVIGGIVGSNRGEIKNCTNTVNVFGNTKGEIGFSGGVGGIVGSHCLGKIIDCQNSGDIRVDDLARIGSVGGIAGDVESGSIYNCKNTGRVQGRSIGGIAGDVITFNEDVNEIVGCRNEGDIVLRFNGEGGSAGGVVGYLHNSFIKDCSNVGKVWIGSASGKARMIGGVVGNNMGTIFSSWNSSNISSGSDLGYFGGVAGDNYGKIVKSYNKGKVDGRGQFSDDIGHLVGGVAGRCYGSIDECFNSGEIDGGGGITAHLVKIETSEGKITNCFNLGNVNGVSTYTAGIAGYSSGEIINCYNSADIIGKTTAAGILGCNEKGTLSNCYNTGKITKSGINGYFGGVVGRNTGAISNLYYLNTCIFNGNTKGIPMSEYDMQSNAFIYTLNNNREDNSLLLKWEHKAGLFPIFESDMYNHL